MSEDKSKHTITRAPLTKQSEKNFAYLAMTPGLQEITGTTLSRHHGSSLADVKKQLVYDDLVDDPGKTTMVLLPSEVEAAEIRAEMMDEKYEDLVVTLVLKVRYSNPVGTIRVESVRYSQLAGRIADIKETAKENNGILFVVSAYSEETSQEFWWNDLELKTKPRMPAYGQEYDRKRTAYRNSASGV